MKTKTTFRLLIAICLALLMSPYPTRSLAWSYQASLPLVVRNLNDSGQGSLRQAILDANALSGENTILFALPGSIHLASALPPISDSLVIDGAPHTITLSGDDQVRIFEIQPGLSISLANLTLSHGRQEAGGAIHNQSWLRIMHCRFSQNHAGQGGAIFNEGMLIVTDSQFEDNLADYGGGAIWNHTPGTLQILTSLVQNNQAESDFGGGIFNYGAASIEDTQISNNSAQNGGGGIINWGTLDLTDSTVKENYAKWGAGLDNTLRGIVEINNTWITANHSGHWGGGINNAGELSLSWSQVLDNRGEEFGAGIYNSGHMTVYGTTIARNLGYDTPAYTDAIVGAGVYNTKDMLISFSSVQSNQASQGGGIFNSGNLTLEYYARIVENTSGEGGGGGIFNRGTLTASLCFIDQNVAHAANGGGIFNDTGAVASLTDCQVNDNQVWMAGGGIYNQGEFALLRSHVAENLAPDMGGGVLSLGPLTITDSSVDHNDSYNYAGGVYSVGGLSMSGSAITHNRSWTGGGLLLGRTARIENSTISNNLVGGYGGGIQNYGTTEISYTTITANIDEGGYGTGSGINNQGELTIANSIVAGNTGADNCTGAFTQVGPNISNDASCPGFIVADPRLGPLQDNGGSTLTHALQAGSPALDAATGGCPSADQRGVPRPFGPACDLGTYEADTFLIQIDINPKSTRNLIEYQGSGFLVPVAVLSTPAFNAPQQIARTSLTFGSTGTEQTLFYFVPNKPTCVAGDANHDGLADLVCHFRIGATGFTCGDTRGYLRLTLLDGRPASGSDLVTVIPCP